MENIEYILLAGFIISAASLSGVALIKLHKKIAYAIEKNLEILGALSGGIFLITTYSIGHESLEILGLYRALTAFFVGFILYLLMERITTSHRHKGSCDKHDHIHDKSSGMKVLIGDAIHNIADGLLLVASFGTSLVAGWSTTLSIFLHETPQEISEFIVLKKSGYSTTEASYKNVATALSIFIGIALGFVFLKTDSLQGYLLGISASFFIGIIFKDLFPIQHILKHKNKYRVIVAFIIGAGFMLFVSQILGHSH